MTDMNDSTLEKLRKYKEESEALRRSYDNRWAKNLKLFRGIFRDIETTFSKVRKNREKIFFRKIWSSIWRLTASMYYAFLKDPDTFKIEGRDMVDDPAKAAVLQKIVEYRRDRMYRHQNLFIKFIWGFQNIFIYGWSCGKISWQFKQDEDGNITKDEPEFILYPNDQCFPDMSVDSKDKMRFMHFLNYMTKGELEEEGFLELEDLQPDSVDSNVLRLARFQKENDPISNHSNATSYASPMGGEYPKAGTGNDEDTVEKNIQRYKIYESFWKEGDKIKFGYHQNFKTWLRKKDIDYPIESPYGDKIPVIMGTCLTEPHKLLGEGFPEPLEAPQESINYILNMRKDNVALAMSGHTFVNRFGGVDLESLMNKSSSKYTLMDDTDAVRHEQIPDVTQSAYIEANADEAMMQEMSGVTAGKEGMGKETKATVAQINYTESNAKIDLYIAIVGETFMKDFYSELARQVQRFESDIKVYQIANEHLRVQTQNPAIENLYDLDFEADCIINVGLGTVGREVELRQLMLAYDRGIMTLQATANLAKLGVMPPEGMQVPNMSKIFEMILIKQGHKNIKDFFIQLPPPQMSPEGQGGQGMGGAIQPQVGETVMPTDMNMIQAGSMGGI